MDTSICNDLFKFCDTLIESQNDESLKIGFHGGEPLLNFNLIKIIYNHFEMKYPMKAHYHITTNGSICNREILNFLSNSNIELCVSLDGTKESNDLNRKSLDQKSVHDKVIDFLNEIKSIDKNIKIRMTVNTKNVLDLSNNFKYIYNLGYKMIVFAPDESDKWTKESLNQYKTQFQELLDFLQSNDYSLYKHYIETIRTYYFNRIIPCNGGKGKYHIDTDGSVYPCIFTVGNDRYKIGTIFTGINQDILKHMMRYNTTLNTKCKSCPAKYNCIHNRCKIINEIRTGSCLEPSANSCQLQHIYYDILKKADEV